MPGNWVEMVVFGLWLAALPAAWLVLWVATRVLNQARALNAAALRHREAIREALALARYGAHDEAVEVLREAGLSDHGKQEAKAR